MKTETSVLFSENQGFDFQHIKEQINSNTNSDKKCFDLFKKILNTCLTKDRILNNDCPKTMIIEILQLLNEKRIPVYNSIVEEFSDLIVKIIK